MKRLLGLLALVAGCGDLSDHDGPICAALGDPGCPCTASGECTDQPDGRYVCTAGLCAPAPCPLGSLECPCEATGACGPGLRCGDDGICERGCDVGSAGCECNAIGGCDRDVDGRPLACIEDVCQPPRCELGTIGCFCDAADACRDGSICDDGACVADTGQTLDPPADPKCWTPCRGGEVAGPGGTRVACDADGLLEGCIGDTLCVDGTCVEPDDMAVRAAGDTPISACEHDRDCPETQNCIDGGCYSDCQIDADCKGTRICFKRACRLPCTTPKEGNPCADDYRCATEDGITGVCLPNAPDTLVEMGPRPAPAVGYPDDADVVEPARLVFTREQQTGRFQITNPTSLTRVFEVTKAEHTIVRINGGEVVRTNPLGWLELGSEAEPLAVVPSLTVELEAGAQTTIRVAGAETGDFPEWTGVLSIDTEGAQTVTVDLGYLDSPAGRWSGTVYYLANFGTDQLDPWADAVAAGDAETAGDLIDDVGNALVRRWWAFREGSLSRDEFDAVLVSTVDESWDWPVSREFCDNDNAACYPADNPEGFSIYSDDVAASPVPTGVSQLDLSLNLRPDADDPTRWTGRIDSSRALQYPGNPGLTVTFRDDPSGCHFAATQAACVTPLATLEAETVLGARYPTTSDDSTCADGEAGRFAHVEVPWLVPGFDRGTTEVPDGSGARSRYECRDAHQPLGTAPDVEAINLSLNAANPIPNGRSLRARLEVLDGGLVNGEQIFVLFRETLPELLPGQGETHAYGYFILNRQDANLGEEDFTGFEPPADPAPVASPELTCSRDLVAQILEADEVEDVVSALAEGTLAQAELRKLAQGALEGVVRETTPPTIDPDDPAETEAVYYVCHDTGFINDGGEDRQIPCPPGSEVTFFAVARLEDGEGELRESPEFTRECDDRPGECHAGELCAADQQVFECDDAFDDDVDGIGCRRVGGGCAVDGGAGSCDIKGSCLETIEGWVSAWATLEDDEREAHWFRPGPEWRCADTDAVSCDRDRLDLSADKIFYKHVDEAPVFLPLDQAIDEAFRYKTRFQSRLSGASVGFAPQVCDGAAPYCYDPTSIEDIRDRVDCLAHLYVEYFDDIDEGLPEDSALRPTLERFLARNYSYEQVFEAGRAAPTIYEGFETLNAELLIMMGDESYTNALSSRFDLAGQRVATFRGTLFEPDGVTLSGPVGYEMFNFYQATQYYQLALDRLYSQLGTLGRSLDPDFPGVSFIDAAATVSWFDKLIRASAQKARVWAKIAERYHGFERPLPAQRVIEKAYAAAYLESIFFAQLQRQVLARVGGSERAQVERQIKLAQLTYKDALVTMQNVREGLADDVNVFGFADTYIPFVALDPGEFSAFEKVMERAWDKVSIAAEKEGIALEDRRSFDVDAATFQAQLTEIELDNTSQLAEICGYFEVETADGVSVYPATAEYAYFDDDERTRLLGDPCGLMGNGQLADALVELEKASLSIEEWRQRRANLLATAEDEEARIGEQCDRIEDFADWRVGKGEDIVTWNEAIQGMETTNKILERTLEATKKFSEGLDCILVAGLAVGTNCPGKAAGIAVFTAASNIIFFAQGALDIAVAAGNVELVKIEQDIAEREILEECDAARIDGRYVVKDLMRQVVELDLEGLQLAYDIKLKSNAIKTLRNQAICVQATLEEQKQLTIDVEAARNDPNVRVYRNDAVRNADRTFDAALREAFRATRMYEYYTNTTYELRDQLPLVRMVVNGDYPLDAYLSELEEAYFQWEESFGNADLRVDVISVVDDVFQLPRLDRGRQLSPAEIAASFAARLSSTPRDRRGAHLIDFQTNLDRFSPLTHNHKIRFIEVEFVGEDLGDDLGRAYVVQRGDGIGFLAQPDGTRIAYTLPQRTGVVDTFFNGERPLSDALGLFEGSTVDVYRNERLRDRPAHHSGWQLVLNFEDEFVNQDIDPARIEDVRIYLWYTDFTEL